MPDLRVFISSTFRDLQEEREHLVKKIFPEIRALCRERGITFTEVDLRWGLTDEDVALGQVIRTCLDEVDHCRPYFIGITGDRYGFVPSYLDIQKDPLLVAQHSWTEDAAIEEMSITEMEAQYAVLNAALASKSSGPAMPADRARFYFRHRATNGADDGENDERQRLEAYQQRIRQSGARISEFRDASLLGELIYDDLIEIIEQDFADARPPTPLEQERARHEAFSLSRRRAYIANPAYLKRLSDHVASDDPPLVVYAESGSGKSSLFAYWAEQYRRKNPRAHVIEHYVGIGATATDHYAVIRHVCMEIKDRLGLDEDVPSDPAKMSTALGQWFGYADHALRNAKGEGGSLTTESDGKQTAAPSSDSSLIPHPSSLIIILDGLNQLQGTALNLRWIPDVISPSIRLILSSTVEGTLVELEKRGWRRFGMQAISEAERETIVVRYLAEYRKSLNPEQIKRISADYKSGHPLFLKTVIEELRLVGRHEDLDAKIKKYLEATGTEDLFQRVLERFEDDYSQQAVREVMTLLNASRSGLDERELSEISGIARLTIATMMAGLDYHLVRKEGRLTFFHDYLRRAVEMRYVRDAQRRRAAHEQLAAYFEQAPHTLRATRELLHALEMLGDHERLARVLSQIERFIELWKTEKYEILRLWSTAEPSSIAAAYQAGLEQWRTTADLRDWGSATSLVAALLASVGAWRETQALHRERLLLAVQQGERAEEAAARKGLGDVLRLQGEYQASLEELERARDLYDALGDRRGMSYAIGSQGGIHVSRGAFDEALTCFRQWKAIAEELGDRGGVSKAINAMGNVHRNRAEDEMALECYLQTEQYVREVGDRAGLAGIMHNMGLLYSSQGKYIEAMERYEQALEINRSIGNRQWVTYNLNSMGLVYANLGEYDRALECYRPLLPIAEELGDRGGVSDAFGNMGLVYTNLGEYDEALRCLREHENIAREIGDRSSMAAAIGNMGYAYTGRGEYAEALECFRKAAEEHRSLGVRHGLTYWLAGIVRVLVELVEAGGDPMPEFLVKHVPGAERATWHAMSLRIARENVEECIAIGKEISSPTLFVSRVLLARITAAEGDIGGGILSLEGMLAEATDEAQLAELHYRLWKLNATDADHHAEALRLYQSLVEKTRKHEYRKRIAELVHTPDSSL